MKATVFMIMALVFACATAPVAAEDAIGSVQRAEGDVLVQRGGERIKAEKGTILYQGDRLITGKSAYAYVEISGAAPLTVGPETDVSLDRFASGGKNMARLSTPGLMEGLASYLAVNRQR